MRATSVVSRVPPADGAGDGSGRGPGEGRGGGKGGLPGGHEGAGGDLGGAEPARAGGARVLLGESGARQHEAPRLVRRHFEGAPNVLRRVLDEGRRAADV